MKKKKKYLYSYINRYSRGGTIQILDKEITDMMKVIQHPFCKHISNMATVQKIDLFSIKELQPQLEIELEELNKLTSEVLLQTKRSLELIK